ncbi:hypothetical protein FRC09_015139, partial [Ceratobasidium sp. 395]
MLAFKIATIFTASAALVAAVPTGKHHDDDRCDHGLFWWGPKGHCLPWSRQILAICFMENITTTTHHRDTIAGTVGTGTTNMDIASHLSRQSQTQIVLPDGVETMPRTRVYPRLLLMEDVVGRTFGGSQRSAVSRTAVRRRPLLGHQTDGSAPQAGTGAIQ